MYLTVNLFLEKISPLDIHCVKHVDVKTLVEDYVLCNQIHLPLKIITGNSDSMKNIVMKSLKSHKFEYQIGDSFNKGYIIVLK